MHADGFSVSLPRGWQVTHAERGLSARHGGYEVSVTRFRLQKPYAPSEFDAAAAQLDRVARQLAVRSGGKVTASTTVTVDGVRARAYTYTGRRADIRIGFVLRGLSEYQLLCRGPAGSGAAGPDGACGLLFDTFSAG